MSSYPIDEFAEPRTPEFIDDAFDAVTDQQYTGPIQVKRAAGIIRRATACPQTQAEEFARTMRTLHSLHMIKQQNQTELPE